jgi:hypothetical protein
VFQKLFYGNALEDFSSEGLVDIMNVGKKKVKNTEDEDIKLGQGMLLVQCNKTDNFFVYSTRR